MANDINRLIAHVTNIIESINKNHTDDIVSAHIRFGLFLQSQFPGQNLDSLQRSLCDVKDCEHLPLPPLSFYEHISEGRIREYQHIVTNEEKNIEKITIIDALTKGLAMFGTLMGGERFENELTTLEDPYNEAKIKAAHDIIHIQVEQKAKAMQSINAIIMECEAYNKYLNEIVSEAILKNPNPYLKYSQINPSSMNAENLSRSDVLNEVKQDEEIPEPIRIAIEKYSHVNAIHNSLKRTDSDIDERLESAAAQFRASVPFIQRNRDTKGIIFLKIVGTIFSLGLAAPLLWGTKGEKLTTKIGPFFSREEAPEEQQPAIKINKTNK